MADPLLLTNSVTCRFGGLTAVREVNLELHSGEIFGIIGPNGAGKTTLFNLLSGTIPCASGQIIFKGRAIHGRGVHQIARLGIGRTFQIVRPFVELTVTENVLAAVGVRYCAGFFSPLGYSRGRKHIETTRVILQRTQLERYARERAANLPLGILRRLEIARVLGMRPALILLDESFSGLSHREGQDLVHLVRQLRADGMTVLMIEHNMNITMELCDRIAVLDRGEKIAEGPPDEIRANQQVVAAYLGSHT
jgi:branched-chain amino acid transport system ATP-binding protein